MSNLLTVCMIVKDEEDVLDRCLNSISKLADEIIIIDTGSTDRTKDIARQYTEHVYDFTWCNDFSAARNESLKYATSKWVLILDADEYIETNDIPSIRTFLELEPPLASTIYLISIVSFLGESARKGSLSEAAVSRLLPNHFGIKFHRPIHEQLCSKEDLPLITKKAAITVYHTGYLNSTMLNKDKAQRNKQIFNLLKSKSGFTAYDYFTIGNEYSMQKDFKKALYYYEKSFKKSNKNSTWHYICVFELINNYLRLDRIYDAWELLEKESVGRKEYPDYHCMQGVIYEHFGLFELAKESFKTAIAKSEILAVQNPVFWLVSPALALETPLAKLITMAVREHNIHDTIYYLTKKLQSDPSDYASLAHLLELLMNYEGEQAVLKFIEIQFPNSQLEDYYLLFKVFLSLGQADLSATYYKLVSDESIFTPHDILRYQLLCGDKTEFETYLNQNELDLLDKNIIHILSLAYLIWNTRIDLPALPDDERSETIDHIHDMYQFYMDLVGDQYSNDWIENNQIRIFELITDLFQMEQYGAFDKYINCFIHPFIIDQLANYFYSKHKYDIAISYYNNLIDSNDLSLVSSVNLALLHINDQLYEDAIPFFQDAIKKSPDPRQLYIQILTLSQDEKIKSEYRQQLFHRYPGYRKLPFLQHLI
ncbi:glycosyltransferase [Paenibacillus sp. NPDC058174]|uniref:tetratricopeptide repeat-containing glycosyltransferase family 2 protein n=1 Tax=Paenibacillus sp. NPDC058174 TaxID=3346366 RepID=UPI0036DE30E1